MTEDERVDGLLNENKGKEESRTSDDWGFPVMEELPSKVRVNADALDALDRVLEVCSDTGGDTGGEPVQALFTGHRRNLLAEPAPERLQWRRAQRNLAPDDRGRRGR